MLRSFCSILLMAAASGFVGCSEEILPPPLPPSKPLPPAPPPFSKNVASATVVATTIDEPDTPIDTVTVNEDFRILGEFRLGTPPKRAKFNAILQVVAITRDGDVVVQETVAPVLSLDAKTYQVEAKLKVPFRPNAKTRIRLRVEGEMIADEPIAIRDVRK